MRNEILQQLKSASESDYKAFQERILHTPYPILGVRIPMVTKISKQILKTDPYRYLKENQHQYYEEELCAALVVGMMKEDWATKKPYVKEIVSYLKDWSICDTFIARLSRTITDLEDFSKFLTPYLHSKKEFDQRFALVSMKTILLKTDSISSILKRTIPLTCHGYYSQMADAWLYAEAAIEYPNEIYEVLSKKIKDPFVQKKSIQKIKESFRISKKDKQRFSKIRIQSK